MKKNTFVYMIAGLLIIVALFLSKDEPDKVQLGERQAVRIEGGIQIIDITARGGYTPRAITAKANTPTVLLVNTQGTFDCSAALVIPGLGYQTNLPPSGQTRVDVPPQTAGTVLEGLCAMGMYSFAITFI